MKKVLLAASIASALSLFNVAQAADSGTITFNGKITAQTCQVTVNGVAATTIVTLPTVTKSSLTTAGDVTGKTKFTFNIVDCNKAPDVATPVTFGIQPYFLPDTTNVNPGTHLLNNITTSLTPAGNVALQLLFSDSSTVVPLGDAIGSTDYASNYKTVPAAVNNGIDIDYFVEYKALTGGATAGDVQGKVDYVLAYQ